MDESLIQLLKIIEIILIASIKFLLAPFEAERYGFNFINAFFITTTGGALGIIIFSLVGEIITYGWRKVILFLKKPLLKEGKPNKKFTWGKRFAIRVKMKFGIWGLAIITPAIISIPVGTFITHRFYRKKARNILFLIISLIAWSLLLNGVAQYIKLSQYLSK